MNFNKYGSLENHYQTGFINKIIMSGLAEQEFVATEKVHGADFGMWYNGKEHKVSKRSGFTDNNFFSCYKLEKYQPLVEIAYENLIEAGYVEDGETMTIFGEIFGGSFYGQSEPNAKCIQGGMNYHPDVEFVAYDVGLELLDGSKTYITYEELLNYLPDELPTVPEIKRGTLLELLELGNAFPTRVPAMFGLEAPEGKELNVAEGLVIKPTGCNQYLGNGGRIAIQSKNSLFSEVSKSPKQKPRLASLSDEGSLLFADFSLYLTENRLHNILSHEGEISWADFQRVSGLLIKDAIEEFNKEQSKDVKDLVGDEWSVFSKFVGGMSQEIVRKHLMGVK